MKIDNWVIQDGKIEKNTRNNFVAEYYGHRIFITRDHDFGQADDVLCRRYYVLVYNILGSSYKIDQTIDCRNIKEAIKFSLLKIKPDEKHP